MTTTTKKSEQVGLDDNQKTAIDVLLGFTAEDRVERMFFSAMRATDGTLVVKVDVTFAEQDALGHRLNIQLVRTPQSKNYRQVPSKEDLRELCRMIADGWMDPAEINLQEFLRERHRPGVSLDMADWEAGLREATIAARSLIIARTKRVEEFLWPERTPKKRAEAAE